MHGGHRMDKVAAAFSWIVGIGRVIYFWFVYFMDLQQINPWLFLVPLFYTIVDVGILIWRQADVSEGKKSLPAFAPSFFVPSSEAS